MEDFDWDQELRLVQQRIDGGEVPSHELLSRRVSFFLEMPPVVVTPQTTLEIARQRLDGCEIGFALVCGERSNIRGVLSHEVLQRACLAFGEEEKRLTVSCLMEHVVCVEPASATVREVMERMTKAFHPCVVIVDPHQTPLAVVSPRHLISVLFKHAAGLVASSGETSSLPGRKIVG